MSNASKFIALSSTFGILAGLPSAAPFMTPAEAAGFSDVLAQIVRNQDISARNARLLVPFRETPLSLVRVENSPFITRQSNTRVAETDGEGLDATVDIAPEEAPASVNAAPAAGGVNTDFPEWQKRADQKLEAEKPGFFEHSLSKDHPQDFVVVCEAGCRGRKPDQIVARTPKPERRAANQASFDPTSSATGDEPIMPAARPPAPALRDDDIKCEAGCYSGPKSHKARPPRRADGEPQTDGASVRSDYAAGNANELVLISSQHAVNGAIVGPHYRRRSAQAQLDAPPAGVRNEKWIADISTATRRERHTLVRSWSPRIAEIED